MIDTKPADWYGELLVDTSRGVVVFAKNSSGNEVEWKLKLESEAFVLQDGQTFGAVLQQGAKVPPRSIAVALAKQGSFEVESRPRILWAAGEEYFKPGKLSVLTQSDLYSAYLVGSLILVGFTLLGFLIARIGSGTVPERRDKL